MKLVLATEAFSTGTRRGGRGVEGQHADLAAEAERGNRRVRRNHEVGALSGAFFTIEERHASGGRADLGSVAFTDVLDASEEVTIRERRESARRPAAPDMAR